MHKPLIYNLLSSFFSVLLVITIKALVVFYIILPEIASFFRHISALIIILPFIARTFEQNPHHFVHKIPQKLMFFRGFTYSLATFLWPLVYTHIPLHIAMTIAFIVPFLSNCLLRYFLNEEIPRHVWVAMIIAFSGVVIILEPHIDEFNRYYALAFLVVVIWATATVLNKAIANVGVRTNIALYYLSIYAVIFTVCIMVIIKMPIPTHIGPILLLGIIALLAQWFTIHSYRVSKGYYVNVFEFLRFLMFLVCDITLFGASLSVTTIIGSVVIGVSVLYLVRRYHIDS